MKMNIQFIVRGYEHIKEKSCYNHNYYKIKDGIDTILHTDILEEVCHEDENYYTFALGNFKGKEFIPVVKWDSDFDCNGIKDIFD